MKGRRSRFLFSMLCFGLAFLYIPIILMMIYSFNHSRLVPVWGGFSTRWYKVLFESEEVWAATALSLKIAVLNATFAVMLGTLAGLALARISRFRGRTLFTGMISAPLVMPVQSTAWKTENVSDDLSRILLHVRSLHFVIKHHRHHQHYQQCNCHG